MPRIPVTDDASVFVQDLGDGPAVLFLHGGCMSHSVWESQVCALGEAGYRVVTPDLRGHGDSDAPESPYTAEMYAADVATIADELTLDSFTLVGWSLGATIALTYAGEHADRLDGLVLVSSSIFERLAPDNDPAEFDLPLEAMLANQRRNRPQGMERFVAGMFADEPDEWALRWLWDVGMQTPIRVALKTLRIYEEPDVERFRETLRTLSVPGAVFHGGQDHAATLSEAESIATDLLSDGTFVPFADSGHVPFIEESARFDEQLRAFLETIDR
ncbi:MAG: alpha/beta fold hydrolase [Haloarculaceae archaeon]